MEHHVESYLVSESPSKVFYLPNFITENEENYLLERILNCPKPKWEILSNRRLQNWGGILGKRGLIPDSDIPAWLQLYINKISLLPDVFPQDNLPNHVLVNEYLTGQGIMPHLDGSLYYPAVTTISLGSHGLLNFYKPLADGQSDNQVSLNERLIGSLLLERRSLVIIQEDMYNKYLHGIDEISEDVIGDKVFNLNLCNNVKIGDVLQRSTRISLTIRNIPIVSKCSIQTLLKR